MVVTRKKLFWGCVALAVVGAGLWVVVHERPETGRGQAEPSAPQAPVRPEPPAPVATTNVVLRAVAAEEPESLREPAPTSSADAVRIVVGADPASANRYLVRSRAVESLGDALAPGEIRMLLDYLSSLNDPLRPERVAALKNDVMNALRRQRVPPSALAPRLIRMFREGRHEPAILDYCIQHLGIFQERLRDAGQLEDVRRCLRDAALRERYSYSGTALIALTRLPHPAEPDRAFLASRTVAIAGNASAHEAARITAMQIASELGHADALPAIRAAAESPEASVSLRTAAIGALGVSGDKADAERMKRLLDGNPNPRLLPALNAALDRIGQRLQ